MADKKVDELEERLEVEIIQMKSEISYLQTQVSYLKKDISVIHEKFDSKFSIMEEMLRRLLEMQTKTSRVVPMANPNQDLIGIPLAESKRKEIRQEEFDEGSFFHQEPPPIAPTRGGSGFLDEGTTKIKSFGGGGRVADHYERHFGQGKPLIREGGGQDQLYLVIFLPSI
ncbi:hypothetical protein IEQ34_018868 [Dendrobium chrysotoxum]|uniref:Uncharacterized protein n=1 Tax=Dendrobium chrysotoxum TaxID=161865 RepID=A0AAV7G6H5_DENCH|nr:hypothetical protein IEQ34_018868 [Dendrobium chrysotoxum]